jgi:acetyl esterase/lipase
VTFPIAEPAEQTHRPRRGLRVRPRSTGNYTQHCNLVYAESDGIGLVMDVFQPEGTANGHAIVDVVSGAWRSDRARLNEHIGLGAIDAFCAAGFTVFAIAPGSATLFTAQQMVQHVHAAIRHVRDHAEPWEIAPDGMGLCGVSAGGHLAALAALQPQPGEPGARQSWYKHDTNVDATCLFFPPTDLLDYGGDRFDFARKGEFAVPRLLFADGIAGHSDLSIEEAARSISPVHLIQGTHPPFLISHATEDNVVPFSQSERFVEALQAGGVSAELMTHHGPGHPWPTIAKECTRMATWFCERLLP